MALLDTLELDLRLREQRRDQREQRTTARARVS
jgi:hypothetical protein